MRWASPGAFYITINWIFYSSLKYFVRHFRFYFVFFFHWCIWCKHAESNSRFRSTSAVNSFRCHRTSMLKLFSICRKRWTIQILHKKKAKTNSMRCDAFSNSHTNWIDSQWFCRFINFDTDIVMLADGSKSVDGKIKMFRVNKCKLRRRRCMRERQTNTIRV